MKYFLHDTNSFQDEKITSLFLEFGYEGVGLFYTILEKIGAQEKPIKTDILKAQLKVGKRLEKCWSFMEEIGIISSSNGDTFNERILSYSNKYQIKKEKNREKISHWRENQKDIKNVTGYETVTKPVRNHSKVKESKVKEIYRANALVVSEETTHNGHSNLRKEYQELTATLPSDSGVLPIWKALSKFISDNSPAFPEPYVDLWNIFAGSYKLPKVDYINETRVKKMGTRLQEQGFDFLKVLGKIKSSSHLKGDNTRGWKVTFDWIIENDSNYLKIIEDQYA